MRVAGVRGHFWSWDCRGVGLQSFVVISGRGTVGVMQKEVLGGSGGANAPQQRCKYRMQKNVFQMRL